LQIDKANGVYYDLYGADITKGTLINSMLITTNIVKGSTYKLRFRARNVYGWSEWSTVTTILAGDKPKAPPIPKFASATANEIKITMTESQDYGGAQVTKYELWRDAGSSGSVFAILPTYVTTSLAMAHTLTFANDAIVTGKIYSFKFRALNAKGYSDFSEILSVASTAPPSKANPPTVDYTKSSRTSLLIKWVRNTDTPSPGGLITGYTLFMDDGKGSQFT